MQLIIYYLILIKHNNVHYSDLINDEVHSAKLYVHHINFRGLELVVILMPFLFHKFFITYY